MQNQIVRYNESQKIRGKLIGTLGHLFILAEGYGCSAEEVALEREHIQRDHPLQGQVTETWITRIPIARP